MYFLKINRFVDWSIRQRGCGTFFPSLLAPLTLFPSFSHSCVDEFNKGLVNAIQISRIPSAARPLPDTARAGVLLLWCLLQSHTLWRFNSQIWTRVFCGHFIANYSKRRVRGCTPCFDECGILFTHKAQLTREVVRSYHVNKNLDKCVSQPSLTLYRNKAFLDAT